MNASLPKYESLAISLQELIDSHEYPVGFKLPSIRRLSEQWQVSIETVQRALNLLEDRGYIEPVAKSGIYVTDHQREQVETCSDPVEGWGCEEPIDLNISDYVSKALHDCLLPGVAPLGIAFPSPTLLPLPALKRCYMQASKEHAELLVGPSHVIFGLEALTLQLHHRLERAGMKIRQSELVITDGCTDALSLALQTVTQPGDVVAVESPGYYLLLQLIEKLGRKALEIPCGENGFCPDSFEIAAQRTAIKACIVCPTASNPAGSVMPDDKRKKLLDVANRHNIVVIEDNIYAELYWERYQPRQLKAFPGGRNVIMCGSFSKCISPSLRMGYVAGGKWAEELKANKRILSGSCNPLTQMALAIFLEGNRYDRHIRVLRRHFETQVTQMTSLIQRYFPPGTRVSKPKGGFVLWVELPADIQTDQLLPKAVKAGTSFMPGRYFSPSGLYNNFMRINCGYPVDTSIELAVQKLGDLVSQHMRKA